MTVSLSKKHWHDELSEAAEAAGHDRFSAAWYAAMNDLYLVRFPNADQRSKDNMRLMAQWAARR